MSPLIFLLATLAVTAAVSPFRLSARVNAQIESRQVENPNAPPPGWSSVGCFTDNGGARTLKAQTFVNDTAMTPALCIEFCSINFAPNGYGFAGVEFGQECWCDGVIQLTANLTGSSECNLPCKGDPTLDCGGSSRISVFTDGTSSPKIPSLALSNPFGAHDALIDLWQYVGCYSDSPTPNRTLDSLVGASDLNQCTGLCDLHGTQGTEKFAGIEAGGECWCGMSIASTAQKLPDIACASMGCGGVNDQACGGEFIMAVYQSSPLISSVPPIGFQGCRNQSLPQSFKLDAVFLDSPAERFPITMIGIDNDDLPLQFGDPTVTPQAGILSVCSTCLNQVSFHFTATALLPIIDSSTAINNFSVIHPGGTTNFVEIVDNIRVFGEFCVTNSILTGGVAALTTGFVREPPITAPPGAVTDPTRPWALCSNGTANGRLDIVFKQLLFLPIYNLTNCRDVELQLV
ncbi:hypothetical protein GALMADRAFT_145744 [Galerina marginata CBS 339.88]|uniref:WSC domain-containing protein n=1 Tax=Galerina marginata (strain CBS 339.88) TaxID=685588 RepID=A0A067SDK4_GALM3|nr:hypothetical protein GALMADRAFT_145744 [Galerina marginata CBS 339.88]